MILEQKGPFSFGENWRQFLANMGEYQIQQAELAWVEILGSNALKVGTFFDVGSGSGIHSLAARRLGTKVHSFDYDLASVTCTRQLQQRYFSGDPDWVVEFDLVGGYPFEIAKPAAVLEFFASRHFTLQRQILVGRHTGKNQFVFRCREL